MPPQTEQTFRTRRARLRGRQQPIQPLRERYDRIVEERGRADARAVVRRARQRPGKEDAL